MPNATILGYNFIDSAIRVLDSYLLNISNYKGRSTTGGGEIRELGIERMRSEPKPARAHSWVCGGGKIRKLENERISKWGGLRSSEENGIFQKEIKGCFDEKRV